MSINSVENSFKVGMRTGERKMRGQIEQLIAEFEEDATLLRQGIANQPLEWFQGQLMQTELAIYRLRAILASPDAVSAEKGADGSL